MAEHTYALHKLDPSSKIWIYQAERELTQTEGLLIRQETIKFVDQWHAHGAGLKAGFSIQKNHFLIIGVDESFAMASGCSIDTSVNLIKKLSDYLKIDFLNRRKVATQNEDNKITLHTIDEIPDKVKSGEITSNTLVFNNLIQTVGDLREKWLISASESWLKRYFK